MDRSSALTERLAVLALAAGLAAMGCGGGSDEGGAAPASQEERQAETESRDGREDEDGRGEDGERGESRSGSISQRSGGSSSISQSSGGGSASSSNVNGRGIKTFSGTGSTKLSFDVEEPSRLVWTNNQGRRFSASGAGISIDSRAGRGEVALEASNYEDVRVSGANWTIVVRPR